MNDFHKWDTWALVVAALIGLAALFTLAYYTGDTFQQLIEAQRSMR